MRYQYLTSSINDAVEGKASVSAAGAFNLKVGLMTIATMAITNAELVNADLTEFSISGTVCGLVCDGGVALKLAETLQASP